MNLKKPDQLYGVYDLGGASWNFFFSEDDAQGFQSQEENRFGPEVFPFWNAWDQFRIELNADGAREPSEEEFLRVLHGEEIDFRDYNLRLEPSEQYFHDVKECMLWLRASTLYIWNHMESHATELDCVIEDYDYYDGFLSRIGTLLGGHLEDLDKYEQLIENIYDGVDDNPEV